MKYFTMKKTVQQEMVPFSPVNFLLKSAFTQWFPAHTPVQSVRALSSQNEPFRN